MSVIGTPPDLGENAYVEDLHDTIQLLHEQAHDAPGDAFQATSCLKEPCRTLYQPVTP